MVKSVEHQLEQAGVKRGVVLIALDGENSFQYFKDGGSSTSRTSTAHKER
ncbi:hypothetical protein P186_0651 [Pyrobaculum ferrireducens]|uniref:Uncharacterized protein n=2 Tax=Pyrobaculum ferrireducens TaxID=1104324 RepID=G7VHT0_9CREN|nr:hypothetical protein P186_0651 [Pyrobaculum ferrireducens]